MGSVGYLDLPDSIINLEHQKKIVSSVESYSFFVHGNTIGFATLFGSAFPHREAPTVCSSF